MGMFIKKNYKDGVIDSFTGDYEFLSNFYNCPVIYNGLRYQNSEAAFQAQKLKSNMDRVPFTKLNPSQAKRLGRQIQLREDWEEVKLEHMKAILLCKFEQNPELKEKLIATYPHELIEGNWWHDTYWGVCNGVGQNNLGKILMELRDWFRRDR